MPDYHAVVWTRRIEGPLKMGDLLVTPQETRFSYTDDFLALGSDDLLGAAGLSLLSSPRLYGRNPVVFPAREGMPLHPRLLALIPGEGRRNIQRQIYTRLLERQPNAPAPGFDMDWALLLLTGYNGIGHLDVFRDDRAALAAYAQAQPTLPTPGNRSPGNRSRFWNAIRDDVALDVTLMDAEAIAELLGPTPSAGGMIPKLLVAIPDAHSDSGTWDGSFARPGTRTVNGKPFVDVVLKIEPMEYQGVAELEALCLQLHREAGFVVPRSWRATLDGLELLAVERFDRDANGFPLPMETFYSVFATGNRRFTTNQDTDLAEVGRWLEKLGSVVNLDVRAVQREFYRRLCFAVCTGNGDLHLQNVAFLGGPGNVTIAPVFDPAPMRAWPRHDVRFAVPLDFDDSVGGLHENLIALGTAYGLTRAQAQETLQQSLDQTRDYAQRVEALATVPAERRERLIGVVRKERAVLENAKETTAMMKDNQARSPR
ncbi:MAG: HipA domain-containing protein [Gammaproteobacteria bacterium]|nr:HipA domain-containing protein [Gammaproteobacteria bacterium]